MGKIFKSGTAKILINGIEVGCSNVSIEINNSLEEYYGIEQITPNTIITEGTQEILGHIKRLWVNTYYLSLLGINISPFSWNNNIPFDLLLESSTDPSSPSLYLYNCRFKKATINIPVSGWLEEEYDFIAISATSSTLEWLLGWEYRKYHIINYAAGAGTNYQKLITVHFGSGIDNDDDVYLNNHCRTDFGDVRFTDDDGFTLLDYWMESKVDGNYAIFWVEVADDLSSINQRIYVYYGKADATTTSNGDNTFLHFDDCDVLTGWTIVSGSWVAIGDGTIQCTSTFPSGGMACLTNSTITNARIKSRCIKVSASDMDLIYRYTNANTFYMVYGPPFGWVCQHYRIPPSYFFGTSAPFLTLGVWHLMEEMVVGSSHKALFDGINEITGIDAGSASGLIGIAFYGAGTNIGYVDWIFASKYVSPEPSHGDWGPEEITTL
jgi:hypothetical protein